MAAHYPELELDLQLCFPLHAAARAVVRAYGPLLEPVGLTYPQYLAMLALWGSPDAELTVGELGERLRLDTGTMTPLLKRLEAAGLVTRRRDTADERRVLLEVTEQGWELRHRVARVPRDLVQTLGLDLDEMVQLRLLLDKLLGSLDPR